jgi:hypothetical protein
MPKQVTQTHNVSLPEKPASIPAPSTLGQAKKSPWWPGYEEAIRDELQNLEKLGCWELVPISKLPRGTNILRSKFVFADKRGPDGKLQKFKARMVAMGFTQIEGVDYNETFASVMVSKSFRTLLAIWNLEKHAKLDHWDVKQAFVNAPLDETIYVHPVKGFEKPGFEDFVLKLLKALYGTKQAASAWQKYLKGKLLEAGGVPCLKDECVYMWRDPKHPDAWLYLSTHVDDIFLLYSPGGKIFRDKIFKILSEAVTVDDRSELSWALSTKIERDPAAGILKISQEEDIKELIEKYGFKDLKGEDTPT